MIKFAIYFLYSVGFFVSAEASTVTTTSTSLTQTVPLWGGVGDETFPR